MALPDSRQRLSAALERLQPRYILPSHQDNFFVPLSEAQARRKETIGCDKLCLFTCLAQRTLQDKLKMGLTLLTNTKAA